MRIRLLSSSSRKSKSWSLTQLYGRQSSDIPTDSPLHSACIQANDEGAIKKLCRLSALPVPDSQEDRQRLSSDLNEMLGFVNSIQQVDTANVRPLRNVVERINAIEISEEDLKSNEEWLRLTAKERHRLLKELVNQEDEQRRPSHSVILSNAKYLYNGTHYAAVPTRDIEPTPTKTESAKNES